MSQHENRQTIERLVRALNERDLELFDEQFHEDSVIDYPQSGERIVGRDNRRAVYGDGAPWQAVIVFELRDGRIAREAAYWTQPFAAAEWRADRVERIEG